MINEDKVRVQKHAKAIRAHYPDKNVSLSTLHKLLTKSSTNIYCGFSWIFRA